jgi:transcription elongation factor GreA
VSYTLPMDQEKYYLSQEKFEELQQELADLKSVQRKKVAEQLEYAKSLGDLSENAEYHEARDRQAEIEDRIKEVELIIKNAVIVDKHHSTVVEVGSTLVIKKNSGAEVEYTIVGSEESDAMAGKISNHSPLGQALLGNKTGDTVKVTTPKGEMQYKIVKIK